MLLNWGAGGDAEAASFGVEFGGTQAIDNSIPFSVEISEVFTDNLPEGTLDYPIPHNNYRSLGKREDDEIGVLLKTGYNFNKKITLQIGVGLLLVTEYEVVESNVTGWYYKQTEENKAYGQYYGGLLFRNKPYVLSLGYNNQRGVVGGFGITWSW